MGTFQWFPVISRFPAKLANTLLFIGGFAAFLKRLIGGSSGSGGSCNSNIFDRGPSDTRDHHVGANTWGDGRVRDRLRLLRIPFKDRKTDFFGAHCFKQGACTPALPKGSWHVLGPRFCLSATCLWRIWKCFSGFWMTNRQGKSTPTSFLEDFAANLGAMICVDAANIRQL